MDNLLHHQSSSPPAMGFSPVSQPFSPGALAEPADLFVSQALFNAAVFDVSLVPQWMNTSSPGGQYNFANGNLFGSLMPMQSSHLYAGYPLSNGGVTPSNHQVSNNNSNPSAQPSTTNIPPTVHVYRDISPYTPELWLEVCMADRKTVYKCTWPNCSAEPATKTKMDAHVYQHLGVTKLFECSCGRQFGSLASAKRHSDNQIKRFECGSCHRPFARRDYRNFHQKKCAPSQ